MKMRFYGLLGAAAMVLLLAIAPATVVAGEPPIVYNESWHDVTETIVSEGACGAGSSEVALTYNGHLHVTVMPGVGVLLKVSQEGQWAGPNGSGHYTVSIVDNTIGPGETHQYVFSSNGNGTGMQWHITAHATVNADGTATVEFEKLVCP